MDIRARPISFSARPSKASWVTRSRTRRRDRSPILQIQLADLGGYLLLPSGALGLTEAIPSEPPSLARPDGRATMAEKGGGHPFGEPERAHVIPAAVLRRGSYSRCCARTLHAMRGSLLARAVASTLWGNRWAAAASQGPKPCFIQFFGRSRTTRAACMKSMRR